MPWSTYWHGLRYMGLEYGLRCEPAFMVGLSWWDYLGYTTMTCSISSCNRFALSHKKVRIIDDVSANEELGLSTRFKACLLARTPWVFVQDDDHMMREAGLQRMMDVKAKFPRRIIAAFGRDWAGPEPAYIRKAVQPGPCRIALTILMLTDQDACKVRRVTSSILV